MKTILVTGPIGSGKSEVCAYLVSRGYEVYDCDSRTKMLYSLVPGLKCRIEEQLSVRWEDIATVFGDERKLSALEAIVYPYVVADLKAWKAAQDADLVFVESAIALDKPQFNGLYDEVLLVTAPYRLRLSRNPKAASRDALQSFDEDKATYILHNDDSIEDLHDKTDKLLCKLI